MDKEYLENYEDKENSEFERLVFKPAQQGTLSTDTRYPPDNRFIKIKKPVAFTYASSISDIWAQIPFSGSLIILLPAYKEDAFEKHFFKVSEIPKIVDFIKETGKLQVALADPDPLNYEGLDYLDLFFTELNPPIYNTAPHEFFGDEKEIREAMITFRTLAGINFNNYLKKLAFSVDAMEYQHAFSNLLNRTLGSYMDLKLLKYPIVDKIENLIIDDPVEAFQLLQDFQMYLTNPHRDLCSSTRNFPMKIIKSSHLPKNYQPKLRFPYEIGKFLLRKLTYAAQDMRACINLMDNYADYDLHLILESLNEAITSNHPNIIKKNAEELYDILDNVWNDKKIPTRIDNIKIGVPVSIAAIGGTAGAIIGTLVGGAGGALLGGTVGSGVGDFLTKIGFKVGEKALEKFFNIKGENVAEKLAKLRTKSYQANIYDFQVKYKDRIVK